MLVALTDLPQGIDGFKAVGTVSKEDYEKTFEPLLGEARRVGRRVRILYQLGPELEHFTAGAALEDARVGLHYLRLFDGCAIVTDIGWLRQSTRVAAFVAPCPVRVFGNDQRAEAIEWLGSLPEGPAISHRLVGDSGVIVVDVNQPLRAHDFDALAATADPWIAAHGDLQGLVIHTREFPGWENVRSMILHARFVRKHESKVQKIALATDAKLADLAPRIAEHFVSAEMKRFSYAELDLAIEWAKAPRSPRPAGKAPSTRRTPSAGERASHGQAHSG